MGALCVWDLETGEHVATGKAEARGTRHVPVWGEWKTEMMGWMRRCHYPDCDIDDYNMGSERP